MMQAAPVLYKLPGLIVFAALIGRPAPLPAQQKDLPGGKHSTAVSNMAFSAIWVAEQQKYFEEEGFAPRSPRPAGVRPVKPPGWPLGAPLRFELGRACTRAKSKACPRSRFRRTTAISTLSIALRKAITDKFKLSRNSPLNDRIKVFTELGTIGATSPGAVSEQIFKFLVLKVKGDPS